MTGDEDNAPAVRRREDAAPARADKPSSPDDLSRRSWFYVARRTLREFSRDQCTDIAAALTYYSVLALFPALIALLSLIGLTGNGPQSVQTLLGILKDVGAGSVASTLRPTLVQLSQAPEAGAALVAGLAAALWSASGYVGAFGRAMNRMYSIEEGRPFYKLRPAMLLVTAVLVILAAVVLVGLVVSGPAADAVGTALGVGSTVVTIWNFAKWPVILLVVVVMVALLFWATPNIKQPKLRWISVGALFAIVVWILASVGFGFYVANFSNYNKTYGALAGVIVFLLWLWITNLALLFGAELDSELERARELQAGITAERTVQLPPRDTTRIDKSELALAKDEARGRALREDHAGP